MIIRIANRYDIDTIITMMEHYSEVSPIVEFSKYKNEEYVRKMITMLIMGLGTIFLAEHDNKVIGMLISIKQNSIWNNELFTYNELAYWVEPEYRNGTAAYRLIKEYEKFCKELLENDEIIGFTISRLHNSNFHPEKMGYRMIEQTYFKGKE